MNIVLAAVGFKNGDIKYNNEENMIISLHQHLISLQKPGKSLSSYLKRVLDTQEVK